MNPYIDPLKNIQDEWIALCDIKLNVGGDILGDKLHERLNYLTMELKIAMNMALVNLTTKELSKEV